MKLGVRLALVALLTVSGNLVSSGAWAGDDGQAPLWEGIGSIFGLGWGGGDKDKDSINYREHGKIVVPPKMDLPPPGLSTSADAAAWPVNQEVQRKKAQKEEAKQKIAGVGDARLRYTHPFDPNTPVTVRAVDPTTGADVKCEGACQAASTLGSLNPLNWVGMGKTVPLGPEPDRQWLTDPPKGFRAPVATTAGSSAN